MQQYESILLHFQNDQHTKNILSTNATSLEVNNSAIVHITKQRTYEIKYLDNLVLGTIKFSYEGRGDSKYL